MRLFVQVTLHRLLCLPVNQGHAELQVKLLKLLTFPWCDCCDRKWWFDMIWWCDDFWFAETRSLPWSGEVEVQRFTSSLAWRLSKNISLFTWADRNGVKWRKSWKWFQNCGLYIQDIFFFVRMAAFFWDFGCTINFYHEVRLVRAGDRLGLELRLWVMHWSTQDWMDGSLIFWVSSSMMFNARVFVGANRSFCWG